MISHYGNKIFSFYEDAKKLYNGELVYPRFVSHWLTTVCDLKCNFCFFEDFNKNSMKFVDTPKLLLLINELVKIGVESFEFSGGGEPTLHPDCFKIAEYASRKGLKVGLLTNGAKFELDKLQYFSYVRIGLDSATEKTYSVIKGGSPERFSKTIDLVKKLVEVCKNNSLKTTIGLKFMVNITNFHEIWDMIKLSKLLDVDYAHFKTTHNDKFKISAADLKFLSKDLENYKKTFPGFVIGSFDKLEASAKCFMSPIHAVVNSIGDLLICCYLTERKYIVGNVFRNNFASIWNSNRHKNIIKSISKEKCSQFDCRFHVYNDIMKSEIDDSKYNLSFI